MGQTVSKTFTQHFGALQNVSPSQLADRDLSDFEVLDSQRELDFKDPEELKTFRCSELKLCC